MKTPHPPFIAALAKFRDDLGPVGMASLALLAAALAFLFLLVRPLEARNGALESALKSELARAGQRGGSAQGSAATPAERMADFYAFFEQSQHEQADWLARLHEIAKGTGVELRSAQYRMDATGAPLGRYEISLPIDGSYAQIRGFLEKALADIPVLSVDQVSFRRKAALDTVVQADVRLSLHMVKP
jgi:hypothetical protein